VKLSIPVNILYGIWDMAKDADISKTDADFICKELQRRGLLKSYILEESIQAIDFVTYLTDFWDWEKSPYIKEKLRMFGVIIGIDI
jgi:hypothetical protein